MRLLLIILPIIIWSTCVYGQGINSQDGSRIGDEMAKIKQQRFNQERKYLKEEQIAGSPYLDRQFISGLIIKTNNTEFRDIPLRYNIFNNTMEFKQKETILDIADPQTISRIILDNRVFVYAPYKAGKKIRLSYFQLLTEGKFQLLKMYKVAFKGSGEKLMVGDESNSNRFERLLPAYYLRYRNGMAHLIDSQKELIKILQPIPQEVIDFIQANSINTKNEKQLIDLIEYTNKIVN